MPRSLIQQVFNEWKTVTQMELLVQDGILEAFGMFTVTVPTTAQPAYSIDQFAISENGIIEDHEMFTVPDEAMGDSDVYVGSVCTRSPFWGKVFGAVSPPKKQFYSLKPWP